MNADRETWDGIPCILPDWIYTADLELFEARSAVKRRNANYFADVVGVDPSESGEAEILKMLRAAREAEDAARTVKCELVIEARARGIQLGDIGKALGISDSGVSNILSRDALALERKREISRELKAWATLTHLWSRDIDTDEPGESFYRHGISQLLLAQRRFDQAIKIHSRGGGPSAASQKLKSVYETLHDAFLSLTDPVIPRTIAKYVPKRSLNGDASWTTMPDAASASIRHGIFEVVLAKLAFTDSLDGSGSADTMLAGIYMARAMVSLSRPEAMFVSDEMIEFLSREHPELLPSTGLSLDQIMRLHERQFDSDDSDDSDDLDDHDDEE